MELHHEHAGVTMEWNVRNRRGHTPWQVAVMAYPKTFAFWRHGGRPPVATPDASFLLLQNLSAALGAHGITGHDLVRQASAVLQARHTDRYGQGVGGARPRTDSHGRRRDDARGGGGASSSSGVPRGGKGSQWSGRRHQ